MFPTTPIILVLGLTIATCVIAYWSDNLGKKLGKKRLSLFGLRPRQTATVISMVTSVGIMALTLIVLLASSVSLRNALLNYDELRAQLNKLRKAARQAQIQAETAKGQLHMVGKQLETSKQKLRVETQNAAHAKALTGQAKKELNKTQVGLQAARGAERAARSGQTAALKSREAARLAERKAVLARSVAQSGLNRAIGLLNSSRDALSENKRQLSTQHAELKRVQDESNRVRATAKYLGKTNRSLLGLQSKLNDRIAGLNKGISELQQRRLELERLTNYATEKVDTYGGLVGLLGAGKISAGLGQFFAETRIGPESEPAEIRVALRQLLDDGAVEAQKYGARPFVPDDGGVSRALHLAPIFAGQPGHAMQLGEDVQIEQLGNYLSTFKIPVSVRVAAARSFAEGETDYYARLEIVPIKRAFVTGETITSSIIDGTATDAQLFNLLLALVNAGEVVARQRGMAPVVTKENPDFYEAGTNERIFDALRSVQMQARQVRVRLVAAEDATTIDNLRVRFVVERMGTP